MNWRPLVSFFLAVLTIALVIWSGGPRSLTEVTRVKLLPALLVFGVTGLLALTSSWRWRLILEWMQMGVIYPLFGLFRVVLLGLSLGIVVHQDLALASTRITYLSRGRKMSIERAGFSVFLDRWFDVVVLAALVPASGLFLLGLTGPAASLALILIIAIALMAVTFAWPQAVTYLFTTGFMVVTSIIRRVLRRSAEGSLPAGALGQTLTRTLLSYVLVLSFARILIVGIRTWLVIIALGIDVPWIKILLLVPITQVTMMIPLTPGGLGLYEAGWYGALLLQGVSVSDSLLFVVLHRVLSTLSLLLMVFLTEVAWQLNRWLHRPAARSGLGEA